MRDQGDQRDQGSQKEMGYTSSSMRFAIITQAALGFDNDSDLPKKRSKALLYIFGPPIKNSSTLRRYVHLDVYAYSYT